MLMVTQEERAVYRDNVFMYINLGMESQTETHRRICGRISKSKQLYEEFLAGAGLGLMVPWNEGTDPHVDYVPRLDAMTVTPIIYRSGAEYTKQTQTVDVNSFVRALGPMLRDSAIATRNKMIVDFLAAGFPGGTSLVPGGKTLFATDHDAGSGQTQSNSATSPLDYTSTMAGAIAIARQRGKRSIPRTDIGKLDLIYGAANMDTAQVAVRSVRGRPGTSDGDAHQHLNDMFSSLIMDKWIDFDPVTRNSWYIKPSDDSKSPLSYMEIQGVDVVDEFSPKMSTYGIYVDFWGCHYALHHFGVYGSRV